MNSTYPYPLELRLRIEGETRPDPLPQLIARWRRGQHTPLVVNADLADTETGVEVAGIADIDLDEELPEARGVRVGALLGLFLDGDPGSPGDARALGRWLLRRMLASPDVRDLWNHSAGARGARPLRLEVRVHLRDEPILGPLPFEIMADDDGFLFRRRGARIVRALPYEAPRTFTIGAGAPMLVAWANPNGASTLEDRHFEDLARSTRTAAEASRLTVRVRDRVHRRSLREELRAGAAVLSLTAHGAREGGSVLLHAADAGAVDMGDAVSGADLATWCKDGATQLALLWSCHGALAHPSYGSVAARLLAQEHGDLAAVVAAHAALDAPSAPRLAERLLNALRGADDLEEALSEARLEHDEADLQWAALVLHSRPAGGRTGSIDDAIHALARPVIQRGAVPLELAPRDTSPHFLGRDADLAAALDKLRRSRVVDVTGMVGVGKTEMSLALARTALSTSSLGVARGVWIELDGVVRADDLAGRIGDAFDLPPQQKPDVPALRRVIGQRRALIVLDNTEDVLEREGAAARKFLAALLAACAGVTLLSASRTRLALPGIAGEEHRLDRLLPDTARELFVRVAGARLRLEEPGDRDALGRVLEWCDGHARSLVLLAGQVGAGELTLRRVEERLRESHVDSVVAAELVGEEHTDQPHELLRTERLASSLVLATRPLEKSPRAAEMLAWLAHFPAGLPRRLLTDIFGPDAEEGRAVLLRRYLAEERDREERLVLATPVRAFARRHLQITSEERRRELALRTCKAFAQWFGALSDLLGRDSSRVGLDMAVRYMPNIQAITDNLAAIGDAEHLVQRSEAAVDLIEPFAKLMAFGGRAGSAVTVVEKVASVLSEGQHLARARTSRALGDLLVRSNRVQEAEHAYLLAQSIHETAADQPRIADTTKSLGDVFIRTDRIKKAEQAYRAALSIYETQGDARGQGNTLIAMGRLMLQKGQHKEAETAYRKAMAIFESINYRLGLASSRVSLADLLLITDRPGEAEPLYPLALEDCQVIDFPLGLANAHRAYGGYLEGVSRFSEAEQQYQLALAVSETIDDQSVVADAQLALGALYYDTARPEDAEKAFRSALVIWEKLGYNAGRARALAALGFLFSRTARPREAEDAYERALAAALGGDDPLRSADTQLSVAQLLSQAGHMKEAEHAYRLALSTYQDAGSNGAPGNAHKALGDLFVQSGKPTEAEQQYRLAITIYEMTGDRQAVAWTCLAMAPLLVLASKNNEAELIYQKALNNYEAVDDRAGLAVTYCEIGDLLASLGRSKEGESAYQHALELHRANGDQRGVAYVSCALGQALETLEKHDEAEKLYHQSIVEYETLKVPLGIGYAQELLGNLLAHANRIKEAEVAYRTALTAYQSADVPMRAAHALARLGNLLTNAGELTNAEEALFSALTLYEGTDSQHGISNSCCLLSRLFVFSGKWDAAEHHCRRAIRICEAIGNLEDLAVAYHILGVICMSPSPSAQASPPALSFSSRVEALFGAAVPDVPAPRSEAPGRLPEAEQAFRRAVELHGKLGNRAQFAKAHCTLAEVLTKLGRPREVQEAYRTAIGIYGALDVSIEEAAAHMALAEALIETNDLDLAEQEYRLATNLHEKAKDTDSLAMARCQLGDCLRRASRAEEAEHEYEEALRLFEISDNQLGQTVAQQQLGRLLAGIGRIERAQDLYRTSHLLCARLGAQLGVAESQHALGGLSLSQGLLADAERSYRAASSAYAAVGNASMFATTQKLLGDVLFWMGRAEEAIVVYRTALHPFEATANWPRLAMTMLSLGHACTECSRLDAAKELYTMTGGLFAMFNDPLGAVIAFLAHGGILERMGSINEAEVAYSSALEVRRHGDVALDGPDRRPPQNWVARFNGLSRWLMVDYAPDAASYDSIGRHVTSAGPHTIGGLLAAELGDARTFHAALSTALQRHAEANERHGICTCLLLAAWTAVPECERGDLSAIGIAAAAFNRATGMGCSLLELFALKILMKGFNMASMNRAFAAAVVCARDPGRNAGDPMTEELFKKVFGGIQIPPSVLAELQMYLRMELESTWRTVARRARESGAAAGRRSLASSAWLAVEPHIGPPPNTFARALLLRRLRAVALLVVLIVLVVALVVLIHGGLTRLRSDMGPGKYPSHLGATIGLAQASRCDAMRPTAMLSRSFQDGPITRRAGGRAGGPYRDVAARGEDPYSPLEEGKPG